MTENIFYLPDREPTPSEGSIEYDHEPHGLIIALSRRDYIGGLHVVDGVPTTLERANPGDAVSAVDRRLRHAARNGNVDEFIIDKTKSLRSHTLYELLKQGHEHLEEYFPDQQELAISMRGIMDAVDRERRRHWDVDVVAINQMLDERTFPYWVLMRTRVSQFLEDHRQGLPMAHDLGPLRAVDVAEDGRLLSYVGAPDDEEVEYVGRVELFEGEVAEPN